MSVYQSLGVRPVIDAHAASPHAAGRLGHAS